MRKSYQKHNEYNYEYEYEYLYFGYINIGTILVTIIYVNKHDSSINPGNRYNDICRSTSVTILTIKLSSIIITKKAD